MLSKVERQAGVSLHIDGAKVSYEGVTVLHSLSLSVEPGEFFCLLGPSGCGKTTLLNLVAGFLPLQAGRVLLGGEDVTLLPPQHRQIGVVFQSYALYPHMTVGENVGYGLRIRNWPSAKITSRVDEMLSLVQLQDRQRRYPRQLSGGEQQRVAIARALAVKPRLLLLDEPLSNLDARLRSEMRTELARIQRTTGVTTVFVTHDQEEALSMADRVAVLNSGRVEQVGAPHEIYRRPQTPFVASFVGRSNVIHGTIEQLDGQAVLSVGDHSFGVPSGNTAIEGPTTLMLRPEEIWLDLSPRAGNNLPGTIVSISYGGSLIHYRVSTAVGEFEVCRLDSEDWATKIGAPVHIGWPDHAGHLTQRKNDA